MKQIIKFQKDNGLVADGVIGMKTLTKMKEVWKRSSLEEVVHYLGQVYVESDKFNRELENLNYSAKRLLEVFKRRFDTNRDKWLSPQEKEKVKELIGSPVKIGSFVYANLNGNGNEASQEGYVFRGSAGLQLTGKRNYERFSKWIGAKKTLTAEEVAKDYFWEAGLFFFEENRLWRFAKKVDIDSITKVSKAINLGNPNSPYQPNHLKERIEATLNFNKILK